MASMQLECDFPALARRFWAGKGQGNGTGNVVPKLDHIAKVLCDDTASLSSAVRA